MIQRVMLFLLYTWLGATVLRAQEKLTTVEDPVHNQLRALRDGMLNAFEQRDIDRMLTYLHENVIITYQNAEVSRGHSGVRAFHERMTGKDAMVTTLSTKFRVDELSIMYGDDTAVAFGDIDDTFELTGGMNFDLSSRWTATLTRENDRWLIAALHVSTNMFDNGVSDLLIKWNSIKVGLSALLIGAVLGIVPTLVVIRLRRRRT